MRALLRRLQPAAVTSVNAATGIAPARRLGYRDIPDVPLEKFGLEIPVQPSVYNDLYNKHTTIVNLPGDRRPKIATNSFVAPSATLIGNVELWDQASVWYDCVINADKNLIRIGAGTNVQDGTVITEADEELNEDHDGSTIIGHWVTIGHRCVLKACTVEDHCLVGMGSVLSIGSYMESYSILGAGSVLVPWQRLPSGQVWVGNPAKYLRDITHEEEGFFDKSATNYTVLAAEHAYEFYLPGHAYLDAEKKGIPVGYQVEPLSGEEGILLEPHYKEKVTIK